MKYEIDLPEKAIPGHTIVGLAGYEAEFLAAMTTATVERDDEIKAALERKDTREIKDRIAVVLDGFELKKRVIEEAYLENCINQLKEKVRAHT